jgi:hypothetical protein
MTDSIIPFFEDASPDTELQRRVRQSQRLRVWRSLSDSYGKDPSKPTEAFNASLGPFVDDYIAQQERMRQDLIRATKRTESSPATSEWIANPDYARMSWDDVDSLAATESGISKAFVGAGRIVGKTLGVAEDIGASFVGGTVDLAGNLLSVAGALPEQAIELFRTAGYSPPAFRKMFLEDLARQGMTSREIARIEQQITPQTQEEFIQEGGFFPTVSGIARGVKEAGFALTTLSQQAVTPLRTPLKDLLGIDGVDPQSTYGAALSGVRSLPPMLAVAPLYPVLGVHGAGAAFVVPVYGQALLQAEQKGLSGQAAHTYALGSAGVEYLTNIVPGGKFLAGMKLKSPLIQRIKDQLPAELVQENMATAIQDLLDMAVLEPEKTLEEYLRERPERAWHTIVATTVGVGALNTTVRVAERMAGRLDQQQAATQVGDNVLQAVIEGLRNSKVQQRSPRLAGMFANMSLGKQGADVARIDSEVLQQILTESGVGDEFLQEFPGIAEQLNQNGTDPGTEVELSSGEFAAQMALNERYADIAERMRPNLRLGASEFSLAEESQIEAERQRIRQDMDSLAQQQVQDAEENANQRQAILKELTDFAVQMPGINKKKAADQAEVAVSMWSNLAKANNMKVGELWDLMKPVLAAGDITIPEMTGGGILSQPSVGEDYEGPEPRIPQEMLSEGDGQEPGSVKFTKWDDLIRFVDAKTESDVLGALASVTGRDVGPAATEAEVAESASEAMASAITGELTGQQWRDLSSKLLLAGDAESSLVGYVSDIASSLIAGGDSSVFRVDEVQLSESQMRANAMQASMLFVEFAKRHENLSRFVEDLSQAEVEGAGAELRDWNSPVYKAFERVADEMSVAQAYELLGDFDTFAKQSYGDDADALSGFKDRLATAFGYEYLGNDEMISERAAYEQSVRDPDALYAPQLPRITPEQDAAYMEAVESKDTNKQEELVDRAANNAGYNIFAEHQTSEIFTEFKAGEFGFHVGNGIMPGLLGHETMELWVRISNPLRMRDLGVWSPERVIYSLPESLISDRERESLLEDIDEEMRTGSPDSGDMFAYYEAFAPIRQLLKERGYDGIVYKNEAEGGEDSYIAFDPEQLKSADPITRDADGNVIPLSQRFDVTQPSILYAPPTKRGDEYSSWAEEMAAIQRRTSGEQPKGALSKVADSAKEWLAGIRKKFAGGVFSDAFTRAERTGDVETGRKLVEAAAMQAGKFVFPANHGLREGILRGAEFDVSLLGKNTGAASAAQGVFTSKGRSTAGYYALPPARKSATPISNKDVNDRLSKALGKLIYERRSPSGKTEVVGWWHFNRANMATKGVDAPAIISEYADYVSKSGAKRRVEALGLRSSQEISPVIDGSLSPSDIVSKLEEARSQMVLSASAANKDNHKILRSAAKEIQAIINQVNVDYDLQPSEISATGEGGVLQLYVIFDNPYIYDQKGEYGRAATYYSIIKKAKAGGHDGVVIKNTYDGSTRDDIYVAFSPTQMKSAEPFTYDKNGKLIPLQKRFNLSTPSILYAPEADAGRRGAYEPRPMRIILTQKADATTLIHEFTHHYLHSLSILAHNKDAPEAITTQFQTLLDWFGVADVAAWDALPADQKAVHHEAFTYNFEQFIGTGKAPTKRLRDVFKRVAAWMRKIYGDIRGELNAAYRKEFGKDLPALTPEVREVFEAMLGAESGTAEAAAELGFSPVFQSQEESGMNDEEWEAYNLGAELVIDEATSTLTASTARAMRWLDGAMARVIRAKTKQAKKERKAIRDRIKAEVEQQPVYRVMNMLRRGVVIEEDGTERKVEGQHRLNAEAVKQMFPADTKDPGYLDLSSLRAGRYGMIAKDGIDPAVVADQFGYDSAAQMIRDLVAARPINDVINERTNKEIEKRHPELSPAAIKQAAMESLHNEAMSKFVATELRFLAGIQKPTRIVVEAARREAEAKIATLGYKSLTPSKFLAAERRAARTAEQWMRSGDRRATIEQQRSLTEARKALREAQATGDEAVIADAQLNVQQAQLVLQQAREELAQEPGRATVDAIIRAKWNQLYQGMLYREAVAARKRFEKHQRYLRRIAKDSKRKRILPEYADQIDYILRRLNISGVSRATSEQMSADRVKFLSWLEEQTNQNIEYSMSEGDLNLLAQRPIEDIPMESLDAIVDTIESIYHRGFVIRNGVVMQQKKRIRELQKENVSEVNQHAGKERPRNTTPATVLGRVQKSLYTFFNQHIKTAARARVIGGGKHGVFWNTFIRPANRQAAEEQQMIADFSQRLEGILQPFYERGAGTIDSGKTMARRKFNKSTGEWESDPTRPPRSLTHEEVFVLALNLGNESNIQRVVDGFGITIEEAREITSSLSAGELRAVQQIWDLFAELKPKISAMERRLYGKEPKWLTPAPIALQSNDGTTVELSGGYFPIKYDRSASELGIKIEAANEARTQLQGAFMGTQTRDSYKKTRADRVFGKPLLLQTSTLFNGLTEIVHDLSWREYIVDFNLLMPSDGAIPQAIIDRYGAEWMQDIRQWVKDIAAAGPGPVHPSEAWMQALRRSISISRLGFSPITGLLQQTGTVIAVEHVGAKHVADAVAKFMGDMRGSYTEMLDKSPAMRNRFRTQFRELGEQAARIRGKTTTVMQFERAAYSMILHSQMIPDTITWHAAYSRAFEDNPNISEQEAADRAYQAVLDTQGSGDITNLSTIERGGPASKLLTVFYTWQNTLFNELYVIAKTEGLSQKGAFQLAMLAIALPFLTVAIRDIAPDDEEERRKRLTGKGSMSVAEQYLWATLKESINTLGGSMVGVREVIPTIASVLSGERAFEYRGPAGFAPMTDFIGAVRAGAESGIMSKRFAKQSMYFLGDIGRLPSTQINRMIDGIDAMVEGKDVPWWAVVLGTQK